MKKTFYILLLSVFCMLPLAGCGRGDQADKEDPSDAVSPKIRLTVWGAEEDKDLLRQLISGFQKEYEDQADFLITIEAQGESACKDALLGGLEEGADVFTFADDQLNALAAAGALEPVADPARVAAQHLPKAVEAASVGNTLFAYPLTADNGYFLYYDKQYLSEEDVRTLDGILENAAENGKYFSMDWSSAWYVYAFFGGAGMDVGLNEDGITNHCAWNQTEGTFKGVDVAQAMLDIAASPGFSDRTDEGFMEGVRDGSVIAGVSGVWNAVALGEIWGDDLGAAKLPTYTCRDEQVQMASFSGCKLIGVNAYSQHYDWACRLAEWLTSESAQQLRFELRGQGPSNINASRSPAVQESPAISALLEQSGSSQIQRVGGKLWEPVSIFAENMAAGNPTGMGLQDQLDQMVEDITAR